MQITKEQIIEVLNGYAYQQKSCELDKFIIDADFSSVADEILTLLQSNGAGQPNASKPIVRSSAPKSKAKKKGKDDDWFNSWDKVIKSL